MVAAAQGAGVSGTWLIAGGEGQLGRCLVEELSTRDMAHLALGRAVLDITDAAAVDDLILSTSPSVVVNAAGWTAVDAAEDHEAEATLVNVDGARNLARASCRASARFVHVSTDYVFDGSRTGPYDEDSSVAPASAYGRSKASGEAAVNEAHHDGTWIVRTAWLYSRHGRNFCKTMVDKALGGHRVRVVADQHGQPTHARDLASHIVDLVAADAPTGIYHGTNSGEATWHDFASEIYRLCGADTELVEPCSTADYPARASRPTNSVLSHSRTVRAGVPEMVPWPSALAHAIEGIVRVVRREST